jgi:hypothetical protein
LGYLEPGRTVFFKPPPATPAVGSILRTQLSLAVAVPVTRYREAVGLVAGTHASRTDEGIGMPVDVDAKVPEVHDVKADDTLDTIKDRRLPSAVSDLIRRSNEDGGGVVGETTAEELEASDNSAPAVNAKRQKYLGLRLRITSVYQAGLNAQPPPYGFEPRRTPIVRLEQKAGAAGFDVEPNRPSLLKTCVDREIDPTSCGRLVL